MNRVRLSATFTAVGLAIQSVTLHWQHPLSFFVFAGFGIGAVLLGVLLYLGELLQGTPDQES